MQQYFITGVCQGVSSILLEEEQAHHIQRVLRMKEAEQIRIVDETGAVYLAEVHHQGCDVIANIIASLPAQKPRVSIQLALALIKGERWDFALQKSCELGVSQILPVMMQRCVVKIKAQDLEKKQKRWNKIALEACEQCKRSDLVSVTQPCTISELCKQTADLKLVAYENADHNADQLKQLVAQHPEAKTILCVIGPEGGFTKQEVDALLEHGFLCASLGPRILRAETAALSIVNTLSVLYES